MACLVSVEVRSTIRSRTIFLTNAKPLLQTTPLRKYVTKTINIGQHGKQVIGFRITSHRNDATNGWYKLNRGQVLGGDVEIEFPSYKTRGCDWSIEVWVVDKLVYEVHEGA